MSAGEKFPKTVEACDVVNSIFGPGLFSLVNGHAKYDEVWMKDGGRAFYLARVTATSTGLRVTRRWIEPDAKLLQYYDPMA